MPMCDTLIYFQISCIALETAINHEVMMLDMSDSLEGNLASFNIYVSGTTTPGWRKDAHVGGL